MSSASTPDNLAAALGAALAQRVARVALAESCTGGLVAKRLTDIAGSSAWFECGVVSYSNEAKQKLLGVDPAIIEAHGAVSGQCAEQMVSGVLRASSADWGIALTGVAGPGGGTADKPVGTVWIAWQRRGEKPEARRFLFTGDRSAVREQSADAALQELVRRLAADA